MTKNVDLHRHKWSKMTAALGSVTETGSGGGFSGGSYSSVGGPALSSYSGVGGSNSYGFANRIKSLIAITEQAKRAINDLDVDGVIGHPTFHDDHLSAISLQSKLTALETYSGRVHQYLTDKIDRPFYEKLDKVGDRLEALTIARYKTSNQIGFKKTEVIYSEAGQYMGTREVLAKEVGLKELYQIDNPYKTSLQAQYEAYKSSDAYKESKLSEEDYLFASHQTRAFTYHSLTDEKAAFEGVRDLVLGAGVVILTIFCPPAGAAAGFALASADMYSAVSGKDWGTGRELDDGERLMRGAFALFDVIPGVGYVADLGKTGKVAGYAGIKASLKTSFKEGMEQAAKNADNFKLVLKHVDDFGKKVVTKIDDFGQQLDHLAKRAVISGAEELSAALRTADNAISEAARNFRLNIGLEPQLIDGAMPNPPGQLSDLADRLQTFAKGLEGSLDEVVVPKILNGYNDFSEFTAKVANSNLSLDDKVKKLHEAFDNLVDKTDINVPSDSQYLKGFTEWGTPDYDWPPKLGFQEDTVQGIDRESGLPDIWDRYGYMGGGNFSDVPTTGPYTYSERAIPYLENPNAYHTGIFNRDTYFDKIDAIRDGNLNKLNQILEGEGIDSITEVKFKRLMSDYNYFLDNTSSQLNISINEIIYGVHGKAAPWGDMIGGAEQIVTPFNGQTMKELGIQKEIIT